MPLLPTVSFRSATVSPHGEPANSPAKRLSLCVTVRSGMSEPLPPTTSSHPLLDGDRRPQGVVILNWRDTTNPEGGGSELFVERVAAGRRPVTLVCAAHPGAPAEEVAGGVRVLRRGSQRTVYLRAFLLHAAGRLGRHQAVIDVQNGMPFLSA